MTTTTSRRTPADGVVIQTFGLRKAYGAKLAVDGLDLEVRAGEVFGFLGPNGAGKTTTIKLLLGLARPTSGRAEILGRPPGDRSVMGRIGFLPEHFRFPPWLRARELMDLHGRLLRLPEERRRRRATELLERVGLADAAELPIGKFSKGMSQRIGLAQALIAEPEVVILDEPTSGLDPLGRRDVREIIHELRAQGVSVFLNSHLLSEVESTCDRVAVIRQGRVARTGTLQELSGGDLEVTIRAAGVTDEALARIGRHAARAVRSGEDRLAVVLHDPERLPAIAEELVRCGARLYEMTPRRLSLEELFLRILREEP